MIIPSIEERG